MCPHAPHHAIQESSKDLDTFRLTLATEATEHMRFREAIEDKLGSSVAPATRPNTLVSRLTRPHALTVRELDKLSSSVDTRLAKERQHIWSILDAQKVGPSWASTFPLSRLQLSTAHGRACGLVRSSNRSPPTPSETRSSSSSWRRAFNSLSSTKSATASPKSDRYAPADMRGGLGGDWV